jgi:hypothetical protein
MISFIKEQLTVWRIKKNLRAYTQPDRAFLKSARARFVTLAQQQFRVRVSATGYRHSLKYATVTIAIVFAMTSGMAVFADVNNVPATHPLYNFKRVSEQVRVGLSSPVQQVRLHKTFAQRRLQEASELKNNQPKINPEINQRTNQGSSPNTPKTQDRIDRLNKDFQNETDHGLDLAKDSRVQTGARVQFCQDILNTIKNNSESNRLPTQMVDHIKSRCGENGKNQKD